MMMMMIPFTKTQLKELELQTLIFNYMASGIPVPSHLIANFKRTFYFLDPYPLHPSIVSFGRKAEEDPEPWRCKRTDGKKWRCSKEAFQDSKYCERHMNRGKKSSRKLVELPAPASATTCSPSPQWHPLEFSPHHHNTHLLLGSASYMPADRSHRSECYNFFSKASGEEKESPLWFGPLGMSTLGEPKQSISYSQLKEEEKRQQHCYVLGTDLMLQNPVREREQEAQKPKPLLCLFSDCAERNKMSRVDPEATYSKTQLSISIP